MNFDLPPTWSPHSQSLFVRLSGLTTQSLRVQTRDFSYFFINLKSNFPISQILKTMANYQRNISLLTKEKISLPLSPQKTLIISPPMSNQTSWFETRFDDPSFNPFLLNSYIAFSDAVSASKAFASSFEGPEKRSTYLETVISAFMDYSEVRVCKRLCDGVMTIFPVFLVPELRNFPANKWASYITLALSDPPANPLNPLGLTPIQQNCVDGLLQISQSDCSAASLSATSESNLTDSSQPNMPPPAPVLTKKSSTKKKGKKRSKKSVDSSSDEESDSSDEEFKKKKPRLKPLVILTFFTLVRHDVGATLSLLLVRAGPKNI